MKDYRRNDKLGKQALKAFLRWLTVWDVPWRDATRSEQANEIDVITQKHTYEVKHQTYSNSIVIEEVSMRMPDEDDRPGWIYTSKAEFLIEVSADRKSLYKIDMKQLRDVYVKIKGHYDLHWQWTKGERGDRWQSAHRTIPLNALRPYVQITRVEI